MCLLVVFTAGLLSFLFLDMPSAHAWGPGVHMIAGNWVLQNLSALPSAVASVIMAHPGQFLYGSLSPDIFIGKGSKSKKGHSHNWQTGLLLLRLADTPQRHSYAYGYLAHLAADTVAHNVYVPQKVGMAPGQGRLAHVYLEMQADRLLKWDSQDALAVFNEDKSSQSAALLRKAMRHDPLSFWIKNQIFKKSIIVGGARPWKSAMAFVDRVISDDERVAFAGHMLTVSVRAIISLLKDPRNSPVRRLDPIGAGALENLQGHSLGLDIIGRVLQEILPLRPSNVNYELKNIKDWEASKNNLPEDIEGNEGELYEELGLILPDSESLVGLIESPDISLASASSFDLPDPLLDLPPVCIRE